MGESLSVLCFWWIPIYTMQLALLLVSILHQLNKICHDFLWGSKEGNLNMHMVSWQKICRPKASRGLGIPCLRNMNLALLSKLIWNLLQQPNSLCNQLLQSKYGGWQSISRGIQPTDCSLTWRGVQRIAPAMRRHVAWQVTDGCLTLFWFHCWLATTPLITQTIRPISSSYHLHLVSYYQCSERGWNMEELQRYPADRSFINIISYAYEYFGS